MRLSMVSEKMSSVAAYIHYRLNVDRCTSFRIEGPGAARTEVFKAVREIGVKAGDDKIGASAPSLRSDKIVMQVESLITALGRAQKHKLGIGKKRKVCTIVRTTHELGSGSVPTQDKLKRSENGVLGKSRC